MIVKCLDCNQPMTETNKNKPKNIPPQNKWILCRECNKGIEVIGSDAVASTSPVAAGEKKEVQVMRFTETKKVFVELQNIDGKVVKKIYSDENYTKPIGEEVIG